MGKIKQKLYFLFNFRTTLSFYRQDQVPTNTFAVPELTDQFKKHRSSPPKPSDSEFMFDLINGMLMETIEIDFKFWYDFSLLLQL